MVLSYGKGSLRSLCSSAFKSDQTDPKGLVKMCECACLVTQTCLTLCNSMDCSPPGSSVHEDSPGKNTGVGGHALLWGILPTQGLNPGLPYCRQTLYHLSKQGRRPPWAAATAMYQFSSVQFSHSVVSDSL